MNQSELNAKTDNRCQGRQREVCQHRYQGRENACASTGVRRGKTRVIIQFRFQKKNSKFAVIT